MTGTPDEGGQGGVWHAIACPTRSPQESGFLMRGLVLCDDLSGNATPLAYLVTPLPRPRPDLSAPFAPGTGPGATAPTATATATLARVIDVLGEIFAELACVVGTQVDLVGGAVETERHCLGRLPPIEIVYEQHLNLLRHGSQPFC